MHVQWSSCLAIGFYNVVCKASLCCKPHHQKFCHHTRHKPPENQFPDLETFICLFIRTINSDKETMERSRDDKDNILYILIKKSPFDKKSSKIETTQWLLSLTINKLFFTKTKHTERIVRWNGYCSLFNYVYVLSWQQSVQ